MAIKFPPGARATFIAAAISVLVGISGTSRSVTALFTPQPVVSAEAGDRTSVAMSQAMDEFATALAEYDRTAERRALTGANALVSALLFLAGVHLWRRQPTAVWWMTQAALANLLYTGIDVALLLYRIHHSPRFVGALSRWVNATMTNDAAQHGTHPLSLSQVDIVSFATIAIVVSGVLRGLVYLWLYWRTRRNDVRAFIAQPRVSEPPPE